MYPPDPGLFGEPAKLSAAMPALERGIGLLVLQCFQQAQAEAAAISRVTAYRQKC